LSVKDKLGIISFVIFVIIILLLLTPAVIQRNTCENSIRTKIKESSVWFEFKNVTIQSIEREDCNLDFDNLVETNSYDIGFVYDRRIMNDSNSYITVKTTHFSCFFIIEEYNVTEIDLGNNITIISNKSLTDISIPYLNINNTIYLADTFRYTSDSQNGTYYYSEFKLNYWEFRETHKQDLDCA
jgi:hypothetical protein